MFSIKNYYKFLVLIGLIIFGFILGVLSINSLGQQYEQDINYTFEKDVYYSSDDPTYYDSFNVREVQYTESTGEYPATYSFTNDIIGTHPDGWTVVEEVNTKVSVEESIDGHNNYLKIIDNSPTNRLYFNNSFPVVSDGQCEFWWRYNATETLHHPLYLYLTESSNTRILILFNYYFGQLGGIRNQIGASSYQAITTANSIDTWFHVKIVLDDSLNVFEFFLNGNSEGTFDYYSNSVEGIDEIMFGTRATNSYGWYDHSIDAIGYSWDCNATYYDSTYTFDDDIVGTEPDGWDTSNNDPGCTTLVKQELDNQFHVLEIYDNSDSGRAQIKKTGINEQANQYIEIDIAKSTLSANTLNTIYFRDVSNNALIILVIDAGSLYYNDGPNFLIKSNFIEINKFFRVKMVLDDTNAEWDCYVNGILEVANIDYVQFGWRSVAEMEIYSFNTQLGYSYYYDNILISSDIHSFLNQSGNVVYNYYIGDNIYPLTQTIDTGILEVDKYEFKYYRWNDYIQEITNGYDNPNGWYDIEDGGDDVNCQQTDGGIIDLNSHTQRTIGLQKLNFDSTSDYIDVSFKFKIKQMTNNLFNNIIYQIYSSDDTINVRLYIDGTGQLFCNYVHLASGFILDVNYIFELSINYESDECILQYWSDGVYTDTLNFPVLTNGKNGLKKILVNVYAFESNLQVYLDSIGVYSTKHKRSLTTEYGCNVIEVDDNWYYYRNNLIVSNIIGEYGIYVTILYPGLLDQEILIDVQQYDEIKRFNVQNALAGDFYSNTPQSYFWIRLRNIEFTEFSVEGIKIKDDYFNHSSWLGFTSAHTDESYFYLDSSNRLQFNLNVSDNDLEYIEAKFNIQDIACENRSIKFTSDINGVSDGALRLSYLSDTSTYFEFPYYKSTTSIILPQKETIKELIIIISDNNANNADSCIGYISNIRLIYYPNIGISITTLTLVAVMIPLIIMLAPPLAMSAKFGKKIIIPMFILMTVICFAVSLIPIWLFFVIVIGSSGFLVLKRRVED